MPPKNVPTTLEFMGKSFMIWEDIDNKFLRACLAEFLAMHLFVLLSCGCAMVTLNLPEPNLMMVAASFGFCILVLAQVFGPLSGGHINCAVSFGLFLSGRVSLLKACCYTLSQMLGSVFGALFLWAIFGNHWPAARAFGSNSFDDSVFNGGQVFFAEMLGTALLMFSVLSTIDIPQVGGGPLGVFPIAMSVMIAHLFLLPIDGCSINPTRSFGPSLVAQWAKIGGKYASQQAIFWFGPLLGSAIAAIVYEYGSLKPENFAGAKDMDTAIFQANKRKVKRHSETHASHAPAASNLSLPVYAPNEVDNPLHKIVPQSNEVPASPQASPSLSLYYASNSYPSQMQSPITYSTQGGLPSRGLGLNMASSTPSNAAYTNTSNSMNTTATTTNNNSNNNPPPVPPRSNINNNNNNNKSMPSATAAPNLPFSRPPVPPMQFEEFNDLEEEDLDGAPPAAR